MDEMHGSISSEFFFRGVNNNMRVEHDSLIRSILCDSYTQYRSVVVPSTLVFHNTNTLVCSSLIARTFLA